MLSPEKLNKRKQLVNVIDDKEEDFDYYNVDEEIVDREANLNEEYKRYIYEAEAQELRSSQKRNSQEETTNQFIQQIQTEEIERKSQEIEMEQQYQLYIQDMEAQKMGDEEDNQQKGISVEEQNMIQQVNSIEKNNFNPKTEKNEMENQEAKIQTEKYEEDYEDESSEATKKTRFCLSKNKIHEFTTEEYDCNTIHSDETSHHMTQEEADKVHELPAIHYTFSFVMEAINMIQLRDEFEGHSIPKNQMDPVLRTRKIIKDICIHK